MKGEVSMKTIEDYRNKRIGKYGAVCFWRDYEENGYLSNWYRSDFEVDGVTYNCMEQYFMAEKARLFGDKKKWKEIMQAKKPNIQKALGRQVKNFDGETWDANKVDITVEGLHGKFTSNDKLKQKLLDTGESILVEASPYDEIWGVGVVDTVAEESFDNWRGENLLGFALMKVRDEIREG